MHGQVETNRELPTENVSQGRPRDPCSRPRQRLWGAGLPMMLGLEIRQGVVSRYHRRHRSGSQIYRLLHQGSNGSCPLAY